MHSGPDCMINVAQKQLILGGRRFFTTDDSYKQEREKSLDNYLLVALPPFRERGWTRRPLKVLCSLIFYDF